MNNIIDQNPNYQQQVDAQGKTLSQTFVSNVFSWMFIALAITGVTAYFFGTDEALQSMLFPATGGVSTLFWIAAIAPLGLVFLMGGRFHRLSQGAMVSLFGAFAILEGISMGAIFMIYSVNSIVITFGVTAATFGVMAVVGYTTKTDLTKMGSLLFMALIGIIIASVVNWFVGSPMLYYLISIAGVVIFTGLIAYDTQKIKRIGMGLEVNDATTQKLVIMGALSLYLDFINLFLFLLRFFGSRD